MTEPHNLQPLQPQSTATFTSAFAEYYRRTLPMMKHDGRLRTRGKYKKNTSRISRVFSNVRSVLSQCNTRLRLLYFLYDIEIMWRKTIKHAFTMFCNFIKHGFLTNQSARRDPAILQYISWVTPKLLVSFIERTLVETLLEISFCSLIKYVSKTIIFTRSVTGSRFVAVSFVFCMYEFFARNLFEMRYVRKLDFRNKVSEILKWNYFASNVHVLATAAMETCGTTTLRIGDFYFRARRDRSFGNLA